MKKILLILLAVVVVLIGAAVAVPFLLPTETYKQQIEAQVERATGRALAIEGPLDISLLPSAAVTAENVRFANVAGSARPDMVRLKGLQAELKIWPLLRGSVEVDRFVLIEPEFNLEIDADGRANWTLGAPPAETAAATEEGTAPEVTEEPAGTGSRLPITQVKLGDIRIENGTVTFSDARSGTEERLEAVNVDLDLPHLQSPMAANGSLTYKDKPVQLALAVERPLALLEGGSSPVRMTGEAPDLALTFDGAIDNAAAPKAAGAVELNVTSIRDLAAWLAEPLAFAGEGLRTFRVKGQLEGSPTQVALSDATLALDAIEGQGNFAVDLAAEVPQVTGQLDLGAVDLNPYLPPEAAGPGAATGGAPAPSEGQAGAAADWSDEPIELPPIGGANVDFRLSTDALRFQDLQLDRSRLALRLQGTNLTVDLAEIALYGGQGNGQIEVAVVDGAPRISNRFRLENLEALPFLRDAADFDRLRGRATGEVVLQTRGRTQRELVQNLSGQGQAAFRDGAIVGINVAGMVRNLTTALQGGGGEERETDFAELSGSFQVNNGILTNNDLWLQAPALRVAGSGQLNLPERTVNYRIEPKAAPTLHGQGGEREVAGLLVPVIVRGPWDNLTFTPDLESVARRALEDPEAFKEEVEQQIDQLGDTADDVRKALKEGGPEKVLEGVLGQGGGEQGQGGQGADAARKLLKGLFGN
ncbi:MAG TPA: AsmA family protein [Geminicoccaceae bacterium]|nr:AsmA family protein [Geminicoccaceae bacterium]